MHFENNSADTQGKRGTGSAESDIVELGTFEPNSKEHESKSSSLNVDSLDLQLDHSSNLYREPSTWYTQLTEQMGEQVSAVALWDALREQSTKALDDQDKEAGTQVKQVCVSHACMDQARQREQHHHRRMAGVQTMFHLAQLRQALSGHLLNIKSSLADAP